MLRIISILSLVAGLLSSLIIVIDILAGHKQHMWVMNIVWPMTALYSGPLGVWVYYRLGRLSTKRKARQAKELGQQPLSKRKPFWQSVLIGATHCGSGCSLGDIFAEWLIYLVPLTLFGRRVLPHGRLITFWRSYLALHSSISPSSRCEAYPSRRH